VPCKSWQSLTKASAPLRCARLTTFPLENDKIIQEVIVFDRTGRRSEDILVEGCTRPVDQCINCMQPLSMRDVFIGYCCGRSLFVVQISFSTECSPRRTSDACVRLDLYRQVLIYKGWLISDLATKCFIGLRCSHIACSSSWSGSPPLSCPALSASLPI
jgi:hypothetical protein